MVSASTTPGKSDEVTFQNGSISGRWQQIPNAGSMTDVELETASDAAGAFGFIRTEDGAWSKTSRNDFYFVTTGDGTGNLLGRLYHLELNPENLLKPCTLTVVYNADHIIAAGGDVARPRPTGPPLPLYRCSRSPHSSRRSRRCSGQRPISRGGQGSRRRQAQHESRASARRVLHRERTAVSRRDLR